MASSEKPKRSSLPRPALSAHVRARISTAVERGSRLRLGLSGGIDSVVLLHLLERLRAPMGFTLEAVHVDHQLSPHSRAWARFCRQVCDGLDVICRVVRVQLVRSNSIERAARDARYEALLATRADFVVLAHNADDQAETMLLQLLRGAGVKGLAAMPLVREARQSGARGPSILRPLIDVPRSGIEQYARRHRLEWIEDESNLDTRYTRNWLRREVLPIVAQRVPHYRESLARGARNAAEAAELMDELARIDLDSALDEGRMRVSALRALTYARAKNALRYVISERGWRAPDAARLDEALRQTLQAKRGARVAVDLGSCELMRDGDAVSLVKRSRRAADENVPVEWRGERELALAAFDGVLRMRPAQGRGLSAARLAEAPVTIRRRSGGERLQLDEKRPRRTVKNLLQEARVPHWVRETLPFIYCGDSLACIPGVAIDYRFRAEPAEPAIEPVWVPERP